MTRLLLFLLFFVMLAADTLGVNPGIAPGVSVKNAFLYLIFVSILIEAALARNRRIELLSVTLPYALCILFAMFSWSVLVLFDIYPGYSTVDTFVSLKGGLIDHLLVFLVFFYGVLNTKDAVWLLKMMIWTVILANFISILDALNLPDLGLIEDRYDNRFAGSIGEPNQYAAFLALFLPAMVGLALVEHRLRKLLAIAGIVASALALMLTASRGGIVSVVVGAVFGAIFLRKYVSSRAVVISVSGIISVSVFAVAVMYVVGYGDLFTERIVGISTTGSAFDVTSGRTLIWILAIEKMFEQPISLIIGYGWDTYRHFPEFKLAPHNSYLKIFFELGVIGLLLVVFALGNILRVAREGLRNAEFDVASMMLAFVFGFMAVLVAIFFVDLTVAWIFIWAYAGAAMRLSVLYSDRSALPDDRNSTAAGPQGRMIKPN